MWNRTPIGHAKILAELIASECVRVCLDPAKKRDSKLQFFEFYANQIGHVVGNLIVSCYRNAEYSLDNRRD
jgi:hypothetical protein